MEQFKGPWNVIQKADNNRYAIIKFNDGYNLALDDNNYTPKQENKIANLISAAPDMLIALQFIVRNYNNQIAYTKAYELAVEAINKALNQQ